jgi:DNA adenine methylase
VKNVILNEYDAAIYKFWLALFNKPKDLVKKIRTTKINIKEWQKQKEILDNYEMGQETSDLNIGFAIFYLNRCNRSGILNAGPIGGKKQLGQWKIDARFNKEALIRRINRITYYKDRIDLYNMDAVELLKERLPKLNIESNKTLVYLDPPYFEKGSKLYRHHYNESKHVKLQRFLKNEFNTKWVLSYDDVVFINQLYKGSNKNEISVNHFASLVSSYNSNKFNCLRESQSKVCNESSVSN